MKFNHLLKTAAIIVVATLSYFHAAAQQRNVSVKGFNAISVSSGIDLYLTQGNTETLTIKGDNDLIKDVVVEQNGTSIQIKFKTGINRNSFFNEQSIKVYVNYKNLKGIVASGGSDVYTQNTLKADILNVTASGGADVKLTLAVRNLTLTVSGGSDAELKGSGENLVATASGGSDINAFSFPVNNARVSASGGADANVTVNKALEANASGGSDVNYKGNPAVKKNDSKSGDVNHVN